MRALQFLVTLAVALAVTNDAAAVCKVNKLFKKVRDCSGSTGKGLNAETLGGLDIEGLLSQQTSQIRGIIAEAIYRRGSVITLAPKACHCVVTSCDPGDLNLSCGAVARLTDNTVPTMFRLLESTPVTVTGQENVSGCQACGCNDDPAASVMLQTEGRCFKKQ